MRHLGDVISRRIARPLGLYFPRGGYSDRVLGYSPIAYWILNETTGGTAADQVNSPVQDGTYNGPTLANTLGPDGVNYAPLFDGTNDFVNIDTAALRAGVDSTEGTLMCWAKVFNAGVWTDATNRQLVDVRDGGYTNQIRITKTNFNSHVAWVHDGNGTVRTYFPAGSLTVGTGWHHWAWTWSQAGGDCHAYLDGALAGSAGAAPVTWSVTPTFWAIGIQDTATNPWYGWLAHIAFWDTPLTQTEIADLAEA